MYLPARAKSGSQELSSRGEQPLFESRRVQQGCRFSHPSSPQLMTAMTRMSVGTLHVLLWYAVPHTKWTSGCMHQMHYCCLAAGYCTEAQQDLPRVQRAGGGYHVLETSCV